MRRRFHETCRAAMRPVLPLFMLLFVSAMITLPVAGCASASVEIGVTTQARTYQDFGDPLELMTAVPPRCAVLPAIMAASGVGHGPSTNISFTDGMRRDHRPFSLLERDPPKAFTAIPYDRSLNTAILAGRYDDLSTLMLQLRSNGLADPKHFRAIGQILDVEYLLIPAVVSVKVDNASRFTFTGLTFIRTGWISIEGLVGLWHAPTGTLVWQGVGEGTLTAENVVGISPPAQNAIDGLFAALISDFINQRSESVLRRKVDNAPAPTTTEPQTTPSESAETDADTSGPVQTTTTEDA
jgi:hypothetical protein